MNHIEYLQSINACDEAIEYAKGFPDLQSAWDNCKRGDWMLWLLGMQAGEPESDSRKKLVLAACKCARLSLKYIPENELRPLQAIETAENWANNIGNVTLDDVRNAAHAAYAVAYAAYAAYAANAVAYAAYAVAYAAYAADAAVKAANAVANAAADAADAAADVAKKVILIKCAKIVREMYPIINF